MVRAEARLCAALWGSADVDRGCSGPHSCRFGNKNFHWRFALHDTRRPDVMSRRRRPEIHLSWLLSDGWEFFRRSRIRPRTPLEQGSSRDYLNSALGIVRWWMSQRQFRANEPDEPAIFCLLNIESQQYRQSFSVVINIRYSRTIYPRTRSSESSRRWCCRLIQPIQISYHIEWYLVSQCPARIESLEIRTNLVDG